MYMSIRGISLVWTHQCKGWTKGFLQGQEVGETTKDSSSKFIKEVSDLMWIIFFEHNPFLILFGDESCGIFGLKVVVIPYLSISHAILNYCFFLWNYRVDDQIITSLVVTRSFNPCEYVNLSIVARSVLISLQLSCKSHDTVEKKAWL